MLTAPDSAAFVLVKSDSEAAGDGLGVLKAPVDCFCSCSKISCSSFGNLGGEGPFDQADRTGMDVDKVREESLGHSMRTACRIVDIFQIRSEW